VYDGANHVSLAAGRTTTSCSAPLMPPRSTTPPSGADAVRRRWPSRQVMPHTCWRRTCSTPAQRPVMSSSSERRQSSPCAGRAGDWAPPSQPRSVTSRSPPCPSPGTTADWAGIGTGTTATWKLSGYLTTATAGNIELAYAQQTADATDLIIRTGSWLRVTRGPDGADAGGSDGRPGCRPLCGWDGCADRSAGGVVQEPPTRRRR
jgi:hypothetical protein